MSAPEILEQISEVGAKITAEGGELVLEADQQLTPELVDVIRQHKAALIAHLQLLAIFATACDGVEGITPEQMGSLLNDEDRQELLAGMIPAVPTLRAYAQSFARGIQSGRIRLLARTHALLPQRATNIERR